MWIKDNITAPEQRVERGTATVGGVRRREINGLTFCYVIGEKTELIEGRCHDAT